MVNSMTKYIFVITYNFDGSYYLKDCASFDDAVNQLNALLEQEIKTVEEESDYTPSIIRHSKDNVTLMYVEGRIEESREEDAAYYRIFEVPAN